MITTGIIIGLLLVIIGIIGCIAPILPGPQLAYLGIIIFHFMAGRPFSTTFLVVWFLIIVAVIVIDQFLPVFATKKLGGSKYGTRGAAIGTIVGLFGGLLGVLFGPFIGALVGEYLKKNSIKKSIKPALGSFIGIAMSGIIKIALCIILGGYIIIEAIHIYS